MSCLATDLIVSSHLKTGIQPRAGRREQSEAAHCGRRLRGEAPLGDGAWWPGAAGSRGDDHHHVHSACHALQHDVSQNCAHCHKQITVTMLPFSLGIKTAFVRWWRLRLSAELL